MKMSSMKHFLLHNTCDIFTPSLHPFPKHMLQSRVPTSLQLECPFHRRWHTLVTNTEESASDRA